MGRTVDVDDLVGAAEIAERLGVAKGSVVTDWRLRYPDFPQEVKRLAMGRLWRWSEVETWARNTGRLPPSRRSR